MKTKIISILLIAAMLLSIIPATAVAASPTKPINKRPILNPVYDFTSISTITPTTEDGHIFDPFCITLEYDESGLVIATITATEDLFSSIVSLTPDVSSVAELYSSVVSEANSVYEALSQVSSELSGYSMNSVAAQPVPVISEDSLFLKTSDFENSKTSYQNNPSVGFTVWLPTEKEPISAPLLNRESPTAIVLGLEIGTQYLVSAILDDGVDVLKYVGQLTIVNDENGFLMPLFSYTIEASKNIMLIKPAIEALEKAALSTYELDRYEGIIKTESVDAYSFADSQGFTTAGISKGTLLPPISKNKLMGTTRYETEFHDTQELADTIYVNDTVYGKINQPGEEDYFKVKFDNSGTANFLLSGTEEDIDYDLYLYDENGALVGRSTTLNKRAEQIYGFDVEEDTWYYLKVVSAEGLVSLGGFYEIRAMAAATVTVTFYGNGGTPTSQSRSAASGTALAAFVSSNPLTTPTRTNYTFTGWFTAASGGSGITNPMAAITSDLSLYAHWDAVAVPNITVTFNANGGTPATQTRTGPSGSSIILMVNANPLTAVTRSGFEFAGWFSAASGGTQYQGWETVSSNTTLYAHWNSTAPSAITITWNANGGTVSPTSSSKTPGTAMGTLPTATYSGYYCKGWFTSASGGTQITTTSTVPSSNTTYYAQWIVYLTITWNANGGTVSPASSQVVSGTALETLPVPTYTGYDFDGWYTAASGGSKISSTTVPPAGNYTYYAHWNPKTITITWNANGGSPTTQTTSYLYANGSGLGSSVGSVSVSRSGYVLVGWFDTSSASGGNQISPYTQIPSVNTTYYARWTNVAIITWNANGGSVSTTSMTKTIDSTIGALQTPQRAYYSFDGWFTSPSGGTQIYSYTVIKSSETYYAHWTEILQQTMYCPGGGSWTPLGFTSAGDPDGSNYSVDKIVYLDPLNAMAYRIMLTTSKSILLDFILGKARDVAISQLGAYVYSMISGISISYASTIAGIIVLNIEVYDTLLDYINVSSLEYAGGMNSNGMFTKGVKITSCSLTRPFILNDIIYYDYVTMNTYESWTDDVMRGQNGYRGFFNEGDYIPLWK